MIDRRTGEMRGRRRRNRIKSDTKNAAAVAKRVAKCEAQRGRRRLHEEEEKNPTAGE